MQATPFEFRHRYLLHAGLYALGFAAPWNYFLHLDPTGPNAHTWGALSTAMAGTGLLTIGYAFQLLLLLGIFFAAAGAALRTWGSAYLGAGIVQDAVLHADRILADGPYRHLRNPLYLGTWLHTFALALLMPPTGATFTLIAIGLFQLRLIHAEQAFLAPRLGEPYQAYLRAVPSLLPALRPRLVASGITPDWGRALLGEIYVNGVALSFAVLGWRYNPHLLLQSVLVSLGLSLVARGFIPRPSTP